MVPKVAEQVLLHDAPIRATLENWPDPWDFLKRIRVPKTGALGIELNGQSYSLPNTTRYYVAKGGGQLLKGLPPQEPPELATVRHRSGMGCSGVQRSVGQRGAVAGGL